MTSLRLLELVVVDGADRAKVVGVVCATVGVGDDVVCVDRAVGTAHPVDDGHALVAVAVECYCAGVAPCAG